jgi:hypothetical protein
MMGYPLEGLFEEVAFIAYHFHWSLVDILHLEHNDRRRFIDEISAINRRLNAEDGTAAAQGIPLQFWQG